MNAAIMLKRPAVLLFLAGGLVVATLAGTNQWLGRSSAEQTSYRVAGYPNTYISEVRVDLSNPNHNVTLVWMGPEAGSMETGPFRSSPGAGWGSNDCNDAEESRKFNSRCTPKGDYLIEGYADHLRGHPKCTYVTWIDRDRAVSFHYHPQYDSKFPSSSGCVRLSEYAAGLIYENSIENKTLARIGGEWSGGPSL
ncbi:MAG: hypothetical protein KF847_01685 [Pirellulales bacterium]|nr:hypothetical protein [Pirellulales bacterium]